MKTDEKFEKWVKETYPLMDESDYLELDYHDIIKFSKWIDKNKFSGLFDKNGIPIFDGDNVKVFNINSKIVWELGSFCYLVNIFGNEDTIPINGSNITIDGDFRCIEVEKIDWSIQNKN